MAAFLAGAERSLAMREVEWCCVKGRDGCESGLEGRGVLAGAEHKMSVFEWRVSRHGCAMSCRIK